MRCCRHHLQRWRQKPHDALGRARKTRRVAVSNQKRKHMYWQLSTYTSEEDFLQPVLALGLATGEDVDVVGRVLEVGQAVGGLDGEDIWLWSLVHASDVERVEVVQRAQEDRILALSAARQYHRKQ